MMSRKRMQKNQRRSVAHYGVGDFGVAAANAIHAGIVKAPRTPVRPACAIPACRYSVGRVDDLLSLWGWHVFWLFRHHDPGHDVAHRPKHQRREERDHQPQHAHQRDIEIEVFRQSGTYASDLPVRPRSHEPLAGAHCPNALAAIGAEIGVVLDDLAAVIAIHDSASSCLSLPVRLFLSKIRRLFRKSSVAPASRRLSREPALSLSKGHLALARTWIRARLQSLP